MTNNKSTNPNGPTTVPANVANIVGELHRLATDTDAKPPQNDGRPVRGK
jgi:hypothetical protein